MKLQPSPFMQNSVLHLWHVKVFHSYLHCRASRAIVKAIAFPCVFAHAPPVRSYHCSGDEIAHPSYFPPLLQNHPSSSAWLEMTRRYVTKWTHKGTQTFVCVCAHDTHTHTGIQGKQPPLGLQLKDKLAASSLRFMHANCLDQGFELPFYTCLAQIVACKQLSQRQRGSEGKQPKDRSF